MATVINILQSDMAGRRNTKIIQKKILVRRGSWKISGNQGRQLFTRTRSFVVSLSISTGPKPQLPMQKCIFLRQGNFSLFAKAFSIQKSRKNKSQKPGINLSASQHEGYSHTYNTRINTKSSTKDLSLPPFNLMISWHQSLSIVNQLMKSEQVYFFSRNSVSGMQHCLVSQDSDLEAFSRNLTHGSFGAMAFQPAPFTNYANKVFLSY